MRAGQRERQREETRTILQAFPSSRYFRVEEYILVIHAKPSKAMEKMGYNFQSRYCEIALEQFSNILSIAAISSMFRLMRTLLCVLLLPIFCFNDWGEKYYLHRLRIRVLLAGSITRMVQDYFFEHYLQK